MLLFLSEAEAESGEPESEADAESSEAELVEPESKSLEQEIQESGESSKELKRKARKIVSKSIDVSIGYVTSSVSTGKRRKRRQTSDEKDFIGKKLVHLDLLGRYFGTLFWDHITIHIFMKSK